MSTNKLTKDYIQKLMERVQNLYLEDDLPWIIGYSGGKDSTATLQLVWHSIALLSYEKRFKKDIHVISTDTLVEQPIVCSWVNKSLKLMVKAAKEQKMPIIPHRLTPKIKDSYWVNLIGNGYPAPRQGFRWCTSRLKINPSNDFILNMVKGHGETILLLGTRKAESAARAASMQKHEENRIRQWLSPNSSLPNSWVFTPIEDWSNDEVWFYLLQYKNPWGVNNKDLLAMYRGASQDNECPLVVDTSTPSCGNSRFGCWVCTLVEKDKSMEAMIQNDSEKIWLTPLLDLRNEIGNVDENGKIDDYKHRDFRRKDGSIKINFRNGRTIRGPYLKPWREYLLRRLLEIQQTVESSAPSGFNIQPLITDEELREIRRIWVLEKHEFDDSLPIIYQEVTGQPYPYLNDLPHGAFGLAEWNLIKELCGDNYVYLELQSSLLDIEQRAQGKIRRTSLLNELEQVIKRCIYADEDDAIAYMSKKNHQSEMDFSDFEEGQEIE
jgi:DNA sulfur modification protein DndC